jgi:hypothetical protein
MLPGLCKLGFASNSANPLFGSLSGARRRDNGISGLKNLLGLLDNQ